MASEEKPGATPIVIQGEVYTVFRKWEKIYIVMLITLAGWFSTLSSFIYYPVITFVARDLRTTVANINLTVTSYMLMSAVVPAMIGDLADRVGRRPMYVIALAVYFCANIGIAVQDSFVTLLLLRMLQSAGVSGNKFQLIELQKSPHPLINAHLRHVLNRIWCAR